MTRVNQGTVPRTKVLEICTLLDVDATQVTRIDITPMLIRVEHRPPTIAPNDGPDVTMLEVTG